jgi:hypothetical protein
MKNIINDTLGHFTTGPSSTGSLRPSRTTGTVALVLAVVLVGGSVWAGRARTSAAQSGHGAFEIVTVGAVSTFDANDILTPIDRPMTFLLDTSSGKIWAISVPKDSGSIPAPGKNVPVHLGPPNMP